MLDPYYHTMVSHLLFESPLTRDLHFCTLCIGVQLFFYMNDWLDHWLWPLWFIIYALLVCYDFVVCGIWLLLLLRNTGIGLRLFCTFLLQPYCGAYPHGHSHLSFCRQLCHSLICASLLWPWAFGGKLMCKLMISNSLPKHSCLHHGPTSGIAWQEKSDLFPHLPCSVVFGTLHSLYWVSWT